MKFVLLFGVKKRTRQARGIFNGCFGHFFKIFKNILKLYFFYFLKFILNININSKTLKKY